MNNPFIQSVHFRPWSAVFSRVRFACLRGGAFGIALTGLCLAPAAQAQNVNWIQEVGASTGNTPAIYARGSDANIGLNLIPKGNGAVNVSGSFTVNGAPLAGSGATDRLVSGSALLRLSDDSLDFTDTSHATLNVTGGATSNAVLQLGAGRTGNGYAYIDLVGDPTYTDYGLRILRTNGGANTHSSLNHRGTGLFYFITEDAAPMYFYTSNTFAMGITSAGNVGMGTTAPRAKLEVFGGLRVRQGAPSSGDFTNLGYAFGDDGDTGIFSPGAESAANGTLAFYGNNTERMRIASDGNVGIGTTAPGAKLQVNGGIRVLGGPGYSSGYTFAGNGGDDDSGMFSLSDGNLSFYTNNASRVVINPDGNVGIGTTAPIAKLHLVGGNNSWSDGILLSQSGTSGRTFSLASREGGRFTIGDESAGTHRFTINSSGNIGIGTVDPNAKLDVAGTVSATFVRVRDNETSNFLGFGVDQANLNMFCNDDIGTVGTLWDGCFQVGSRNTTSGLVQITQMDGNEIQVISETSAGVFVGDVLYVNENGGNIKLAGGSIFAQYQGNVGIGTTNPTKKLTVAGDISSLGGTDISVYHSSRCKSDGESGSDPLGYCEGSGRALVHDAHDVLRINYANDFDGGVAVGSNLQVSGNVTAAAYYQSSDRRLKTDIQTVGDPFALLNGIEGRHFRWKSSGKAAYGVIAQEVARVMPEAVGGTTSGTQTVDYAQMVAPLIEAVKQLDKRVKALEAENRSLKAASKGH